jgi:hypothetical protein
MADPNLSPKLSLDPANAEGLVAVSDASDGERLLFSTPLDIGGQIDGQVKDLILGRQTSPAHVRSRFFVNKTGGACTFICGWATDVLADGRVSLHVGCGPSDGFHAVISVFEKPA